MKIQEGMYIYINCCYYFCCCCCCCCC